MNQQKKTNSSTLVQGDRGPAMFLKYFSVFAAPAKKHMLTQSDSEEWLFLRFEPMKRRLSRVSVMLYTA